MEKCYRVGDFKRFISESASEFKPVIGDGVAATNKKNNGKSYKQSKEHGKHTQVGEDPSQMVKYVKKEYNRTPLDYTSWNEPSQEWLDKVAAQAEGYTSQLEKNNGIEKVGDYEKNKVISKEFMKQSKKIRDAKYELSNSGLTGSKLKNEKKHTMCEALKPKRLIFKHTKFLNEEQMLSRIPEEYKRDGQRIYMKDGYDNEYIVECVYGETSRSIETNVLSYTNKTKVNEQMKRISELFEYEKKPIYGNRTTQERIDEKQTFINLLNNARKIEKLD